MRNIKIALISLLAVAGLVSTVMPQSVSAAIVNPKQQICEGAGGTWAGGGPDGGKCTGNTNKDINTSLKDIVNLLLFVIGAIAVIVIIIGAIRYTLSSGDSNQITGAKNTILYAVVGLVIAILAYSIVNFVVGAF